MTDTLSGTHIHTDSAHKSCPIIITMGPNKGKPCGECRTKCQHGDFQCELCDSRFNNWSTFHRHTKKCMDKSLCERGTLQSPQSPHTPQSPQSPRSSYSSHPRTPIIRRKDSHRSLFRSTLDSRCEDTNSDDVDGQLADLTRVLIERTKAIGEKYTSTLEAVMREQSRQLEQMATVFRDMLPTVPMTQSSPIGATSRSGHTIHQHAQVINNIGNVSNVNNVTNLNNLTVVLDPNFYDALVRQMGPQETHKYLEHLSLTHSPLSMVHELFVKDRPPSRRPIARRGNHYRFLDQNRNVIDDIDGKRVIQLIETSVVNAYLAATSALIKEGLTDSAPPERVQRFHNLYRYATEFKGHDLSHLKISSYLNGCFPSTDDHPFFEDSTQAVTIAGARLMALDRAQLPNGSV